MKKKGSNEELHCALGDFSRDFEGLSPGLGGYTAILELESRF